MTKFNNLVLKYDDQTGRLYGYEIKWKKEKEKPPKDFLENYKNASYQLITKKLFIFCCLVF